MSKESREEREKKSVEIHLRFTEGMKYDGVVPQVIADEGGYTMALLSLMVNTPYNVEVQTLTVVLDVDGLCRR